MLNLTTNQNQSLNQANTGLMDGDQNVARSRALKTKKILSTDQIAAYREMAPASASICKQYRDFFRSSSFLTKKTMAAGPGAIIGAMAYSYRKVTKVQRNTGLISCSLRFLHLQSKLLIQAGFEVGVTVRFTQVEGGFILTPGDALDKVTVSAGNTSDVPKIVISKCNMGELIHDDQVLVVYGLKGVFVTKSTVNPALFGFEDEKGPSGSMRFNIDDSTLMPMSLFFNRKREKGVAFLAGGSRLRNAGVTAEKSYGLRQAAPGKYEVIETTVSGGVKFNADGPSMRIGVTALAVHPELIGKQLFTSVEEGRLMISAFDIDKCPPPQVIGA